MYSSESSRFPIFSIDSATGSDRNAIVSAR